MLDIFCLKFFISTVLFIERSVAGPLELNCTGNIIYWTSKCMDFNTNAISFNDAEKECSQKYVDNHLYSVVSVVENNGGLLANYNKNITHFEDAWIGLSMEYGELKWSDGEKVDYSNWNLKDANHSLKFNEKYCISFNLTDGTWQPQNCSEKKPFFCGIQWFKSDVSTKSTTTTTASPKFCYNPCFQGNCIFFQELWRCSALYTDTRTFKDSELECSKNGGHLLSIENSGANNDLSFFDYMDLFFYSEEAWIGMIIATNATGFENFSWTDGTPVSFNNLPSDLSLDANKTYCVSFGFFQKFWKVSDCYEKKLFLCNIPNSTVTTVPLTSSSVTSMVTSANSSIKPSSNTVPTTFVTSTSTSLTPPTPPQFLPTSSVPASITSVISTKFTSVKTSSSSLQTLTPSSNSTSLPTTSRLLSSLSTTLPHQSSKFKIWQLLLGIFILILIITALLGYYFYKRRKEAKARKKFLQSHVKSMMESVLHMFKQGYDKRDKWKLEEKDVHINLNKILGKGFNATVCEGTFNEPNISETISSFNFLTKKSFLEVAIKIPKDFEKENVETFVRELDALITIESHPNIIKFFGWILYENTPVFVLELGTISLLEYSKNFREEKEKFPHKNMLSILWQISQALIYISSKMMIHRDVACRNVVLTDTNVAKLADFGLCCHCDETFIYQATTNKRLPYKWLSIEAIVDSTFSEKSDVWAFGILAYEAYSFGAIPYSTLTCEETLEFLQSGSRLEKPAEAFETLYELMLKCWEKEVEGRPKFKDIEKYLRIMLENETFKYGYLALDHSSSGIKNILQ